jgi:hypothetical protein
MLNQNQPNTDPRAALARFHMKADAERRERLQLEQAAAQADQAERLQREQEAERAVLEAKRAQRLTREAYEGLTPAERAKFDERTDPEKLARELAEQAMTKAIEKFNAENEAQRQRELIEGRNERTARNANHQGARHNALQEANQRAAERAAAYKKVMEDRELQAENQDDPLYRIVMALPDDARAIMNELASNRPGALDTINQVKQENAQQINEQKQRELYAAFLAEATKVKGNTAWASNIRAKYMAMGWDGLQR